MGESRVACALQNSMGSAQGQRTQRQAALPIQAARNDSVCPVDTAQQYKWVIYFFVAVAFWNLVGAGIFGFMINPPIALYYMQGLNTTAVHAHGALYGVYGTLGLGVDALLLACDAAGSALARTLASDRVLGDQHRHDDGDPAEPTTDWPVADVSVGLHRILVGAQPRVYADRRHAVSVVDADGRRHNFRHRRGGLWLFRSKINFSAFKGRKTHGTSDMASRSPRSAMIVQPIT